LGGSRSRGATGVSNIVLFITRGSKREVTTPQSKWGVSIAREVVGVGGLTWHPYHR